MKEIKFPLLTSEDIEVKVKQITKAGALALLYKTARVDRKILNHVFGPLNWTSDYKVVKDNLYCGIGIREDAEHDFVWKWDCGIESRSDGDGNEKKGEASDAFKRAGFQVGIGEELYTAPFIWLNVETVQDGGKWRLKDPFAKYIVTHIAYNDNTRVMTELEISNAKTNTVVYKYTLPLEGAMGAKMVETVSTSEPSLKKLITLIGKMVKYMQEKDGNVEHYNQIVQKVTGGLDFRCNKATDADYENVLAIYNNLVKAGYSK